MKLKLNTLSVVFILFSMTLNAQNVLTGDTTLPSSKNYLQQLTAFDNKKSNYNIEDYFAQPKSSAFAMSPDGKYLSYKERDQSAKQHVYVKEISTGKVTKAIEEKDELIREYGWLNESRLYFLMDKGGDENYHIYATDRDGNNTKDLTPFEGVKAGIERVLKEQKNFIIISMNKNNRQIFEPYKLNLITGELVLLFENKDVNNPIDSYEFDKDGVLRGYKKLVNGVHTELYYRDLVSGKFSLIKKTNWDDKFNIIGFNYAGKNKDEAYILTNLDSDKARIVLYNLKDNKTVREIFSNPTYDMLGMNVSRKRNYEVDYYVYEGVKTEVIPVSSMYKEMLKSIKAQLGGKQFGIVGQNDNETKFLIYASSDKLYGIYYEYDVATKKMKLLYDLMPQLKEADMAEMRPIVFKSRDGLEIHGYITLPEAALNGKKVPLIVNPHGGPQGERDSWGFNPEAQLFASRGYATLYVNFRISGSYGKAFLRAGFKQIGRKVMDDLEDGVKYAIAQGWIDERKVAIYGVSHGGYAALMGLIKTPDLYSCGVDYVGISSIFTLFNSIPEYWKPYKDQLKQVWYDLDKPEEAKIAKEVSPLFQVDHIKKPLFVIQGANDPRVKIAESDQIVKALRVKGHEVPYLVKYDEGHGFHREANQIELYKYILGFLAKNFQ